MTLSEQDSGRAVELSTGDRLTIYLKENRPAGHRWAIEKDGGLEVVGDVFEGGQATGSSGQRRLEFRAAKPGTNELRLKYWQEFGGDASTAKRFEATIKIS